MLFSLNISPNSENRSHSTPLCSIHRRNSRRERVSASSLWASRSLQRLRRFPGLIDFKIIKYFENVSSLSPFLTSRTHMCRLSNDWMNWQWWWTVFGSCSVVFSSDIWWEYIDRLIWQWEWKWRSTDLFPEKYYFISSFIKGMSSRTHCICFALSFHPLFQSFYGLVLKQNLTLMMSSDETKVIYSFTPSSDF